MMSPEELNLRVRVIELERELGYREDEAKLQSVLGFTRGQTSAMILALMDGRRWPIEELRKHIEAPTINCMRVVMHRARTALFEHGMSIDRIGHGRGGGEVYYQMPAEDITRLKDMMKQV